MPAVTKLCEPLDTVPRPVVIAVCWTLAVVAPRLTPVTAAWVPLPAVTKLCEPLTTLPRPVVIAGCWALAVTEA